MTARQRRRIASALRAIAATVNASNHVETARKLLKLAKEMES